MSKIKTSDGRVNRKVTNIVGYGTKQNQRSTNRSIRGNKNVRDSFNRGEALISGDTPENLDRTSSTKI